VVEEVDPGGVAAAERGEARRKERLEERLLQLASDLQAAGAATLV